ncbi:MAG TPA: ABC transporter ATP-binding protein [bacterium]|nr:ABC transporter ATP-binding protein [bacterium]
MPSDVIRVESVSKTYKVGETEVKALRDVSISIPSGQFVAIMGPSGSGKSTFMNLLGCLDHPDEGTIFLDGTDITHLDRNERATIRNRKIGFVFQNFSLLARTPVVENVELPLMYSGTSAAERRARAEDALSRVGLGTKMHNQITQLSGGEQQRVAIARSLVNHPPLILADEPTGNLDTRTSFEIMAIFQRLNQEGISVVLVTHELDIATFAMRNVMFRDGRIVSDVAVASPRVAEDDLAQMQAA